jgi:hypothetical protein
MKIKLNYLTYLQSSDWEDGIGSGTDVYDPAVHAAGEECKNLPVVKSGNAKGWSGSHSAANTDYLAADVGRKI